MADSSLFLLDNTVLTNFALVGMETLVIDLWGKDCATTTAVYREFQAGVQSRGLPSNSWNALTRLTLRPNEETLANQLSARLGIGESSCIAVAVNRQGVFVSDDATARSEAKKQGVRVTGTLGILVMNVRRNNLTLAEGNAVLINMIAQGYYSPVLSLDSLI